MLRLLLWLLLLPVGELSPGGRQAGIRPGHEVLLLTMEAAGTTVENLWHALSEEMRAFLRSRVPTHADADDLLQDVFVRVYENIGSLRQADRIEPWVYQIARNAVADFYRRHELRQTDAIGDVVDPQVDSENGNLNHAVGKWLSSMIDLLPPSLQDAVRMYELEGISQLEIASRMGLSLTAVKSRVQRGRKRLAEMLQGSCQLERDLRGNVIACQPVRDAECATDSCECDA